MIATVGIDPGGRSTGIVARRGDELILWRLIECAGDFGDVYLRSLIDTVTTVVDDAPGQVMVGVEDLNDPSPHMGLANVRGLLETAVVIGVLRAVLIDRGVVMVPPGKHGGLPLSYYPKLLVGARETGRYGSGRMRHVRSAWDIAGVVKPTAILRSVS